MNELSKRQIAAAMFKPNLQRVVARESRGNHGRDVPEPLNRPPRIECRQRRTCCRQLSSRYRPSLVQIAEQREFHATVADVGDIDDVYSA